MAKALIRDSQTKTLTFQTRRITANAVIVLPSKVIPPPCTQGAAEASVVYYNWQYLNAKIAKK